MKENEKYTLKTESFDVEGKGVSHLNDRVVFIEGAMEGETVTARITNVHKAYAFGTAEEILTPSSDRIEPSCPYFKECGGCDLLHMNYECEKRIKYNKVKTTLHHEGLKINEIIGADDPYHYRNKVMVPFMREKEVYCGFYESRSHHIIPMENCLISSEISNRILSFLTKYLNVFGISIYDETKHSGLFREVMVRSTALNEVMVVLVLTKYHDFSNLVKLLCEEFPEIKSIYLNINPKVTNVVLSGEYQLIYGTPTITEDILGLKFSVSPASFLQVNHDQCEKLYSEALRMADLKKTDNVIDAYCGMGSITLNIASRVNKVYGIEIVPDAITNAKNNMTLNHISNAEFICGKCEEEIQKLVHLNDVDVIFFDPPRKGCEESFLKCVVEMNIPKIVYVSCNIATCKRDIDYLEKNGYELLEATPVDMFPRTSHVETVTVLTRR